MSRGSFSINVNPAVLEWARKAAGQTISYVAEKVGVSEQTVNLWETGKKSPDWNRLRRLAHTYQRPLAALLLPAPPGQPDVPPDFRTLPANQRELSASTLLAIRTARWLQSRAAEIREELGVRGGVRDRPLETSQKPEAAAGDARNTLGIELTEQTEWQSSYQAYRRWREALEEDGVLIFQFPFPVKEARGFSLFDPRAPVIVVNESDSVNARIFTLFHEYAHILLQKPGICLLQEAIPATDRSIEPYCNQFAAALLIPRDEALAWKINFRGSVRTIDDELQALANRYRVSRDVVLIRMRSVNLITEEFKDQIAGRWEAKAKLRLPTSPRLSRGGPSAAQICQRQRGPAFVSLILDASDRGLITAHDAMTYLGVKLKDLNKLRTKR